MAKQILILNSSPRKGGNTDVLCASMAAGAMDAGHQVQHIRLRRLDLGHCLGCYLCREGKGNPCIQADDMSQIYAAIEETDTVVLAFPLYWWQMNALMKVVIDRLCAVAVTEGIPQRDCAMLVVAGDDAPDNCNEILSYYHTCIVGKFDWRDRGVMLTERIDNVGDAEGTDYPQQARELGAQL